MNNEKEYPVFNKVTWRECVQQMHENRKGEFNSLMDNINISQWHGWDFLEGKRTHFIKSSFSTWKGLNYWDFDKCEKALYEATFVHNEAGVMQPFHMAYSQVHKIEFLPLFVLVGNQCLTQLSRARSKISANKKVVAFLYADIDSLDFLEYMPVYKYKKYIYMLKVRRQG